MMMKIKKLMGMSVGIMLLLWLSHPAEAVRVSFGVSPSALDEFFLEQGDTEELQFTLTNESVLPQGELEELGVFAFDVIPNAFFDDETLDASEWIQFDVDYVHLEPGDESEVTATLTIPDDIYDGFYIMWLEFMRVDDQEAMIRQYSVLRVPLLLYLGPDWVDGTNVVIDFDLTEIDLIVNGELLSLHENASTVWQETFSFLGEMLMSNPLSVARDISNRPVYKIYDNGQVFLDLNRNIVVPLSDVITHRESSLNDWQYIYIPPDDLFQAVVAANIEYLNEDDISIPEEGILAEQVLRIRLANDQAIEVRANLGILHMMMDQMRSLLANFEGTIHLSDLVHELHVPMNRHYTLPEIHIQTIVENSGTIAIRPLGSTSISSGLGNLMADLAFSPANIFNDDMREIWVNVPEEVNFTTGTYLLETTVVVHELEENIQGQIFVNNNFRDDIWLRVVVLYVLVIVLALVLLFVAYRVMRKFRRTQKSAKQGQMRGQFKEKNLEAL